MSALAAIFLGNSVVFATDTITCDPTSSINKKGKELGQTISRFSSKSIYLPHLQTSIAVLGLTQLSSEYHNFIDEDYSNSAIRNLDDLISSTEKNFIKFIDRPEINNLVNPEESEGSTFLGSIFLFGLSFVDDDGQYRREPVMQCFKLIVHKTHITKKLMNPIKNGIMHFMHPPLPNDIKSKIFDSSQKNPTSPDNIIISLFKESKSIYDNSFREETLTGGEINFTSMDLVNDRLNVLQYTGYTFDDIDEVVKEIKSYSNSKERDAEANEFLSNSKKIDTLERALKIKNRVENLEAKYPELKGTWEEFKAIFNKAIKYF